ncbi:MAG TPA: helix-turn-helix domain-containing protein [Candidatus Binataceae bacterium]|nr:helix-turn-helix domain-containing protein [Candidatus Binataceae bacterium]
MAAVARILTAKEVADYLRCHISTVYRLAKTGKLPGFRLGADWRFREDALQNWLDVELNSGNSDELAELGIARPEARGRLA